MNPDLRYALTPSRITRTLKPSVQSCLPPGDAQSVLALIELVERLTQGRVFLGDLKAARDAVREHDRAV